MINHKDFYILGLPIDTELGKVHFLYVKDYPNYLLDLQAISMSKLEVIHRYSEINKDGNLDEMIKLMKKMSLYEISVEIPDLRMAYYNVFSKVFENKSAIEQIGEDNFEQFRKLVLDMNCIKEEKINPNPEIQRAIERSKRVKARERGELSFSDICSSIVAYSGVNYPDLGDFTIYQLYMTFYRIDRIKNYDTTTLFSTVSSEKINIESWSKHIDLYEDESHTMSREQFKSTTGKILDK